MTDEVCKLCTFFLEALHTRISHFEDLSVVRADQPTEFCNPLKFLRNLLHVTGLLKLIMADPMFQCLWKSIACKRSRRLHEIRPLNLSSSILRVQRLNKGGLTVQKKSPIRTPSWAFFASPSEIAAVCNAIGRSRSAWLLPLQENSLAPSSVDVHPCESTFGESSVNFDVVAVSATQRTVRSRYLKLGELAGRVGLSSCDWRSGDA